MDLYLGFRNQWNREKQVRTNRSEIIGNLQARRRKVLAICFHYRITLNSKDLVDFVLKLFLMASLKEVSNFEVNTKKECEMIKILEEGETTTAASSEPHAKINRSLKDLYKQYPHATPNRKHLARNYAQLLIQFLDKSTFLHAHVVKVINDQLKLVQSIQHLAAVFIDYSGFLEYMEQYGLQNSALIDQIATNQSIVAEERIAMLESYAQFVWGIRHPREFMSFTDETKYAKLHEFNQLAQECHRLPYRHIYQQTQRISYQLLQKAPPACLHTKHITQLWLNRIKTVLTESSLTQFFEQRIDEYPIHQIIDRLKSSRKVRLHTFRAFLSFPQIQNFIRQHLIKDNVILKEILEDTRMDVKTKLTLIEKYPIFLSAVEDPESLRSWRNRVTKSQESTDM